MFKPFGTEEGMRKISRMIALVMVALPGAAMAFNTFSMRDMPISYMTEEDREIFMAAVIDTLERNHDRQGASWENPKTGAHGDLTPRVSFERAGNRCRELEVANSARGHDNRVVVMMCKHTDGEWKIESE
jgi:surface antigen